MKISVIFPLLGLVFCLACGNNQPQNKLSVGTQPQPSPRHNSQTNENKPSVTRALKYNELKYHNKPVVLTKHAQCRMDCRHIDADEVQEMLDKGVINKRKSGQSKDESTCPTVALEGQTHDKQTVRIIVAECSDKAKIVTVIDLKNDFKCDCK